MEQDSPVSKMTMVPVISTLAHALRIAFFFHVQTAIGCKMPTQSSLWRSQEPGELFWAHPSHQDCMA